ncbi:MAG: hypothetical protein FJ278_21830, partial [Planctomycetes bacterium]|nr:hypothetical protein [Planctomycetota bacterium]
MTCGRLMLIVSVWIATGAAGWAKNVTLVRDGQPMATIVVSQTASEQVRGAAKTLADYVEQASGAKLALVADDAVPKGTVIAVGKTKLAAGEEILPKGLDDDGFVIQVRGDR